MTPRDAARRFVEQVVRATFDDALDLADPGAEPDPQARARAYKAVETAVRRRFKVRHDLNALEDAVEHVVPKQHQAKFIALSNAIGAEMGVIRQTSYVVGLAVGSVLHPAVSAGLGDGWKPRRR